MTLELRFLLAILACFRLAELVAVDDGPWDMCLRFRNAVARTTQTGARLVSCAYCVGIWIALPLALWVAGISAGVRPDHLVVWFGIAGGQAFLESVGGRA